MCGTGLVAVQGLGFRDEDLHVFVSGMGRLGRGSISEGFTGLAGVL